MQYGLLSLVTLISIWLACSVTSQILQKAAVSRKKIRYKLLMGCGIAYGLSLVVQYIAYSISIPVSTFAPLFNLNQIIIALYANWYLHESISFLKWSAILLILGGCLLIGFS